jgi:aminopeptidase N
MIRQGVFQGLSELKDERALPLAFEWSKYGRPVQARAAAINTLGKLGEGRKDEVFDHLISLLSEWEFRVLVAVIQAFESLKDPKAIPELEKLAERTTNNIVKRRAKEAIKTLSGGLERSKEFQRLRDDVDKMREESRSIRSKLDAIEAELKRSKQTARRLK